MERIEIVDECLKFVSFSGEFLSKFTAIDSEFISCQFEDMKIKDICFGSGSNKSKYVNCSFNNSEFSSNVAGAARFENCTFQNVKIKKLFCIDVEMINCIFTGEIKKGRFVGVHRDVNGMSTTNEFYGNDFTNLDIGDVGFTNIDLKLQKFPLKEHLLIIFDVKAFLIDAKTQAFKITDKGISESLLNVLSVLEIESKGGNNQMLLDKRSFPKRVQRAVDYLFDLVKLKK